MNKKTARFLRYTLLTGVLALIITVFYPRTYDVPQFETRAGTQYWQLSTGSLIGYTMIAGKGEKRETPIIYLHGGPGGYIGNRDIQALMPIADSGYNVYLYDQIGSGESDRLKDIGSYTVARHI